MIAYGSIAHPRGASGLLRAAGGHRVWLAMAVWQLRLTSRRARQLLVPKWDSPGELMGSVSCYTTSLDLCWRVPGSGG